MEKIGKNKLLSIRICPQIAEKSEWLSPFLCQTAKTKVAKIRTFSNLLAIS